MSLHVRSTENETQRSDVQTRSVFEKRPAQYKDLQERAEDISAKHTASKSTRDVKMKQINPSTTATGDETNKKGWAGRSGGTAAAEEGGVFTGETVSSIRVEDGKCDATNGPEAWTKFQLSGHRLVMLLIIHCKQIN